MRARVTLRLLVCLLTVLPIVLAAPSPAAADDVFTPAQRAAIVQIMRDALKKDPSILRDAVTAMQADQQQREQVAAEAAIATHKADLVTPADPVAGNPSGNVTIVEFFDVRCPYCRRFEPAMDELLAKDHGIRLVYKDLPILGPSSVVGAKALLAAQRQGKYLALRTALMRDAQPPTAESVRAVAPGLGIDPERLARDMDDPAIQKRIDANLALAHDLGIDGTPAMVIGKQMVPGAITMAELQSAVADARKPD
jgi:protein-disulfide isomerase